MLPYCKQRICVIGGICDDIAGPFAEFLWTAMWSSWADAPQYWRNTLCDRLGTVRPSVVDYQGSSAFLAKKQKVNPSPLAGLWEWTPWTEMKVLPEKYIGRQLHNFDRKWRPVYMYSKFDSETEYGWTNTVKLCENTDAHSACDFVRLWNFRSPKFSWCRMDAVRLSRTL